MPTGMLCNEELTPAPSALRGPSDTLHGSSREKAGTLHQKSKEKSQKNTHERDTGGTGCSLLLSLAWIASNPVLWVFLLVNELFFF